MHGDVMKTIKVWQGKGKINKNYDISLKDILTIADLPVGICEKINNAFILGYAQGTKAERKAAKA